MTMRATTGIHRDFAVAGEGGSKRFKRENATDSGLVLGPA